jgi:hypothetical protein
LEERGFRRLLKRKLLGLASLERTIARHRSRIHWLSEGDEKAKAVDAFYEQLLGSCPECGFGLDLEFLGMQTHNLAELEVPFSEEEVWGGDPLAGVGQSPGS